MMPPRFSINIELTSSVNARTIIIEGNPKKKRKNSNQRLSPKPTSGWTKLFV
jgi:hypothetical protein